MLLVLATLAVAPPRMSGQGNRNLPAYDITVASDSSGQYLVGAFAMDQMQSTKFDKGQVRFFYSTNTAFRFGDNWKELTATTLTVETGVPALVNYKIPKPQGFTSGCIAVVVRAHSHQNEVDSSDSQDIDESCFSAVTYPMDTARKANNLVPITLLPHKPGPYVEGTDIYQNSNVRSEHIWLYKPFVTWMAHPGLDSTPHVFVLTAAQKSKTLNLLAQPWQELTNVVDPKFSINTTPGKRKVTVNFSRPADYVAIFCPDITDIGDYKYFEVDGVIRGIP